MFTSSPTGGSESMHLMYLMAITAARHTIHLSNAYFVPDELAINALVAAAKRGVEVRIITPGTTSIRTWCAPPRASAGASCCAAGIKIAEYQPTMFHVKSLVVDSLLVSVGSTNFDNRSFSLNDEANLNVLDPKFAKEQEAIFEDDWKHARQITLQQWQARSYADKLADQAADVLDSQL